MSTATQSDHFEQPPAEGFAGWLLLVLGIGGLVAGAVMHGTSEAIPLGPGIVVGLAIAAGGAWLAPQTAALKIVLRFIYHLHYVAIAGLVSVGLALPMLEEVDSYLLRQVFIAGFTMAAPWTIAHLMANASGRRRVSLAYAALATVVCACAMQPTAWLWPMVIGAAVALVRIVPARIEGEPPTQVGVLFNGTAFMLFNGVVLLGLGPLFGLLVMWVYGAADPDADMRVIPFTEALHSSGDATAPWVFLTLRWVGFAAGFVVPAVIALAWPRSGAIGGRPKALLGAVLCLCAAGLMGGQSALIPAIVALVLGTILVGAAAAAMLPFADAFGGRAALGCLGGAVGGTILMQIAAVRMSEPIWGLALWLGDAFTLGIAWLAAYASGIGWLRGREEGLP